MLKVRGRHYLNNEVFDYLLEDGRILAIEAPSKKSCDIGGEEYSIAPGLIDIQVNGYEGCDFGNAEVTAEAIHEVARNIANAGVTSFCPTVTTNSFEVMTACLRAIDKACGAFEKASKRIPAIHLEGPYISPVEGPRGAHPAKYVRPPDWDEFTRFQEAVGGRIGLITVAPELPGVMEFIHRATQAGVIVAIGHHAANREQIEASITAGARLSTHLGNGAHVQLPRHTNYIWEQMANDALMASIIVDGQHLPPSVVKSIYRVKGFSRIILISDVLSVAGLPQGKYKSMGLDIEVMEDESIHLVGTPYLAGSNLKLFDAVHNMMRFSGATLAEAITMASVNPAILLKIEKEVGLLRIGQRANLILFKCNSQLDLAYTLIDGQVCYEA